MGTKIILKGERELARMRPACQTASAVLDEVAAFVKPGVTTKEVDDYAGERMKAHGAKSAFLGYRKFPRQICISVNEQVVHGLGGPRRLEFGDIVSLDIGVLYNGYIGDTARTLAVGGCDVRAQQLMDVTDQALYEGIAQAVAGKRVVDISRAVQNYVEGNGYSVVREFVGHGVGKTVHEEPQVPNFVEDGKRSPELVPGMTLAIEPMVNIGSPEVVQLSDRWTVVTKDGSLSAHFEHTVLVTDGEPEIFDMAGKDAIEVKGRIVETLANALYRVELANGHRLVAHVSGKRRLAFEKTVVGDFVTVAMSPYDLSKGCIVSQ